MKKIAAALILAFVSATVAFADSGFAYGVWYDSPKETTTTNVEGVALGAPIISFQNLCGASFALFANDSQKTTGFQLALLYNKAQSMDGVQIAAVNLQKQQHGDSTVQVGFYNQSGKNGVQFGVINNARDNATFQFGLINVNKNGLLPVMILVNFGKEVFN